METPVPQRIRELILVGALAPGTRLAEAAVAERLGVSRTPVRNALPALATEGLLEPAGASGSSLSRRDEFEVSLPQSMHHLGASITAAVTGDRAAPLIVVLGGISGNRLVCGDENGAGWWPGLVGADRAITPERHRILGIDFAADAEGRVAPSTHDQAAVVVAALDALGVRQAHAIVGASYGGMVALALAEASPNRVERLVIISAGARPHPTATAARELQRRVVALGIERGVGGEALAIARGLAMLTYRTPEEFAGRFAGGLPDEDPLGTSAPGAYLRTRGEAFRNIMTPERFLSLNASIDRHQVDPAAIKAPACLIGAASDQLVPPTQMRDLAEQLGGPAELHLFESMSGHDMFLKEAARIGAIVGPFLNHR